MSRTGKARETKQSLLRLVGGGYGRVITEGLRVSVCGDENILELLAVVVVGLCAYAEKQSIVHFKWVNCIM